MDTIGWLYVAGVCVAANLFCFWLATKIAPGGLK